MVVPCKKITSCLTSLVLLVIFLSSCINLLTDKDNIDENNMREERRLFEKIHPADDADMPLIFIGGVPRSGTTLMRTMLEAHPDIRCGPETHVIPRILLERHKWLRNTHNVRKLDEAGVFPAALDIAVKKFILEIIKKHAPPTTYYCNKDPFVLEEIGYLRQLFPNSKFILMIRDGRASAHSIVARKVEIGTVDNKDYRGVLEFWNHIIEGMYAQCKNFTDQCLPVYYEQLVLQPVSNTKRIFNFLDIPWRREVLHHDRHINETKLSSLEVSTDQVQRPLYLDALTSWFGHIPRDVEKDMAKIAPMLAELGYDPNDPTPDYGKPDDFVLGKLKI